MKTKSISIPVKFILLFTALLALGVTPVCSTELPAAVRDIEAAFDNEVRLNVEGPYDGGLKTLRRRYSLAIEAALKSASSMGRLDESLALKEELLHTTKGDAVPETDEPETNSEVMRLRGIWRQEKARLDNARDAQIKGIAAAYDGKLRQMEERLTKELKLEEAKAVRERRENLGKVVPAASAATPMHPTDSDGFVEHMGMLVDSGGSPRKLKKSESATTKASFKPPVEIIIEAKTDSTNLRISYAANELIFNWELGPELRVGGGPAAGQHKAGAGLIPTNKYVTISWVVTPKQQSVYVDGQLRFEHAGDYSKIDNPVRVFPAHGSEVTVKTIKVKQLPSTK
jgi:hypothetical protein